MDPLNRESSTPSQSSFEQEPQANFLDFHRLLRGIRDEDRDRSIDNAHREWFLNQALLNEYSQSVDPATKERVQLAVLHAFSKASSIGKEEAQRLRFQTSPIVPPESRYHRSVKNTLLSRIHLAYEPEMGLSYYEFMFIDNPLLREVFAREYPQKGLDLSIDSLEKFSKLIDTLLKNAKKGKFPEHWVLIDFTQQFVKSAKEPKDAKQIASEFEKIVLNKLLSFAKANPQLDMLQLSDQLLSKLQLVVFSSYKEQPILLMPRFLDRVDQMPEECKAFISPNVLSKYGEFFGDLMYMLARTGFLLSPDQAKKTWLKVKNLASILEDLDLPLAELATKKTDISPIAKNFKDFLAQPIVTKFRNLGDNALIPYLKVLPKATVMLLDGFAHQGIDKFFKEKKAQDLLQISYFRILNAMQEAILRKEDVVQFYNQIAVIHQEIQNLLAILEPYDNRSFSKSVIEKLTKGHNPVIPKELNHSQTAPKVHLKPSAMHGLASILGAVEAQKGDNHLQVALLKNSYYHETDNCLKYAKTHSLFLVDENGFEKTPKDPLDIFVCEFHHNILLEKQSYHPEDILEQVTSLIKGGLTAKEFTVVIDTTVDLEKSEEMRDFLADSFIQEKIQTGELNAVFLRSAQKFDMLGMDNYYGGISVTLNRHSSFKSFNKRMDLSVDQLQGLSYQGLAHLHKYSGPFLDKFRKAVMKNTQKLYAKLPPGAIYYEGSRNPMQISEIEDERLFFLDIKFPHLPQTFEAFRKRFVKYAQEHQLPLTINPSFSFIHTSLTFIEGKKFRLNVGLEGSDVLDLYASFISKVQEELSNRKVPKGKDPDTFYSKCIEKLV